MKSYKIGRVAGIDILLHSTFVWLILFVVISVSVFDFALILPSLLFLAFLFGSVLFHELSHSLVAKLQGIPVHKITLLPIGGIAEMNIDDIAPSKEFLISIAGPLFNFVICFIIFSLYLVFPQIFPPLGKDVGFVALMLSYPLYELFYINLVLGMFNLFVPAIPMDGGRVLRALLQFKYNHYKATLISAKVSMALAFAMFLIGFLLPEWRLLLIISIFVYLGAQSEAQFARVKHILSGAYAKDVVQAYFPVIPRNVPITEAISFLERNLLTSALIDTPHGFKIIFLQDLLNSQPTSQLSDLARDVPLFSLNTPLSKIYNYFATHPDVSLVPVVENGQLYGVVTQDMMDKYYSIRALVVSSNEA